MTRAARTGGRRRIVITALKVILPLTALGVFASLFLFSAGYDERISFEGIESASLEEGLKLANPSFTGATAKGEPFTVAAAWALPDGPDPDRVEMSEVTGKITLEDGRVVTMEAKAGVLEPKSRVVTLTDGVTIETSDGYSLETASGRLDVKADELTATGGVTAVGPLGTITSEDMRATRAAPRETRQETANDAGEDGAGDEAGDAGRDDGAYIWFENRVKVRIDRPNGAREPG